MNRQRRKYCFELFGYDFLIDEDFRVWLIEVNTNPYLGIPNDFIRRLLPQMIDDMFKIVLDPKFATLNPNRSKNQFELLYCERDSIYSTLGATVNQRRPFTASLYPIQSLA